MEGGVDKNESLKNEENLKILESLPSQDEFLKSLKEDDPKSILPYLNRLHKIIHHILPKPNQVF
jgi:5,10-methenyltetrahydromethanopterin hydrogenase